MRRHLTNRKLLDSFLIPSTTLSPFISVSLIFMGCPILYDFQSMVTGICDVRLSQRKRLGMWKALCRTSKEPVYRQQVTSPYASVRPYQRDVTRALVAKGFTHLCLRLCPAGVGLLNDTGFYSFLLQIVTEGAPALRFCSRSGWHDGCRPGRWYNRRFFQTPLRGRNGCQCRYY